MRQLPILLLLFFCNIVSNAQNIARIREVIDSALAITPFFGNILILKNDQPVFEKSYGYADAVKKVPLQSSHSFQLASISKQFTAYAIMLLNERKLLSYDSSVTTYLSLFPYPEIKVRHLLQHTSGLPDFWDRIRPYLDTTRSNGNKDVLNYLVAHTMPLQSAPGARFEYCDIGYDFLANIIEQASGLSYQQFLKKNIFDPLRMSDTHAYMVTDIARINNPALAVGHLYDSASGSFSYAHTKAGYEFVKYLGDFYGDGSVVSTTHDLAVWAKAWKACTLLPCVKQQAALIPPMFNGKAVTTSNKEVRYGFGLFLKAFHPGVGRLIYHGGSHPGNVHAFYMFPDKDMVLIFLCNSETEYFVRLRNRIISLL